MRPDAPTMAPTPQLSPEAEAFVASVGAATNLPAFVRNVRAISSVASNLDARVAQLEQAIVQDVALSAKVIRLANSVSLSQGAATGAVASVKQAIMLLGYDRVQHLSAAASVFEQIEQDAPSVRDLLVESVLAANHSLQLSVAAGYEKPELAYLCAMFRRLGEVLVACYRPRPYREWLRHLVAGGAAHEGAEGAHFGFTFEDVGIALARRWSMPPDVVRTMHTSRTVAAGHDLLHAIAQCSSDIARCLYGAVPSPYEVADLREQYARAIGVDVETMAASLTDALEESKAALSTMHVDLEQWLTAHAAHMAQLAARRADGTGVASILPGTDGPTSATFATVAARDMLDVADAHVAAQLERVAPRTTDSAREAKLRDTLRTLVEAPRADGAPADVGVVTQAALRAACDAGYERGVLALSTEDFKLIRGRVGIGRGGTELARQFLLRPAAAFGPLGAALQQRDDLFVELSGAEARLYGRDRLIKELTPSHFALLPLVVEQKLIGCLYFDSTVETVEGSETARALIRDLRDQLVFAFARRRAERQATEQHPAA